MLPASPWKAAWPLGEGMAIEAGSLSRQYLPLGPVAAVRCCSTVSAALAVHARKCLGSFLMSALAHHLQPGLALCTSFCAQQGAGQQIAQSNFVPAVLDLFFSGAFEGQHRCVFLLRCATGHTGLYVVLALGFARMTAWVFCVAKDIWRAGYMESPLCFHSKCI